MSASAFFCQFSSVLVVWTLGNLALSVFLVERHLQSGSADSQANNLRLRENAVANGGLLRSSTNSSGRQRGIAKDAHSTTAQSPPYIPATVVITGTVRNVKPKEFENIVGKLRRLGSYFEKYHILVYENNSRQSYKKEYQRVLDQNPLDFTFVSEEVPASKLARPDDTNRTVTPATYADKTTRLALARNKVLTLVQDRFGPPNGGYEYMMVTDFDHACGEDDSSIGYSPSVMREVFTLHGGEWDSLTFKHIPYWDFWAFRQRSPLEPKWWYNMYGPLKRQNANQGDVKQWINSLSPTSLYEVESAFMMMAIYRIDKTIGAKYSGWGSREKEFEESDCEHVSFHRSMTKQNDARIRLWPVVYCQAAEGFSQHHAKMDQEIGALGRVVAKDSTGESQGAQPKVKDDKSQLRGRVNLAKLGVKMNKNKGRAVKGNVEIPSKVMVPARKLVEHQSGNDTGGTINIGSVIWSKNWHKIANACPSVPDSYYKDQTAKVQQVGDLMGYFAGCKGGGIIWIRSGSTNRNSDVSTFIDHILPQMTEQFSLVTSDGDIAIPSRIKNAKKLLESPLLLHWYTQNCDGCNVESANYHEKLRPIPIGLDLHSRRDYDPASGLKSDSATPDVLRHILSLRSAGMDHTRDGTLLVPPWNAATSAERIAAENAVECIPHEKRADRISVDRVWELLTKYRAGLSPRGNGMDTHRTWEMLLLGMTPIVKSGPLDKLYDGLPVIIAKDWEDLCQQNYIEERLTALSSTSVPDDVFTLQHWVKPIGQGHTMGVTARNVVPLQVLEVTNRNELCGALADNGGRGSLETVRITSCLQGAFGGVGNGLMEYYSIVLAGLAAGLNVLNGCSDPNMVQSYGLDIIATQVSPPVALTWEEACDMQSCEAPGYPGTCRNHINNVAGVIRRDFQSFAKAWQSTHPSTEIDDVSIHWRCGDILTFPMSEYGFVQYETYADAIESSLTQAGRNSQKISIGIISAPLDSDRCRKFDCKAIDKCKQLLDDVISYLQGRFPEAIINARNDSTEDILSSFARMVASDVVICGPSTFCILPTISSEGQAAIVQSDKLYPWTNALAKVQENIKIISDPFIPSTEARSLELGALKSRLRNE